MIKKLIFILLILITFFLVTNNLKNNNNSNNSNKPNENVKLQETFETMLSKEPYYIKDNKTRYLEYHELYETLLPSDIITHVNSNIDYDFYTNINNSDTTKETLMLVNKYNKLDKNYEPNNLVSIDSNYGRGYLNKEAYQQMQKLVMDGYNLGYNIYLQSPYRSYATQEYLYNSYVQKSSKKEADTYSARPGHSEHQTGLSVDVCQKGNCSIDNFGNTKEYDWMKNNAHKYGFIIRYPKDKEYITGYIYEPWHYRYVGVEQATYIYENNLTFEEYYAFFVK